MLERKEKERKKKGETCSWSRRLKIVSRTLRMKGRVVTSRNEEGRERERGEKERLLRSYRCFDRLPAMIVLAKGREKGGGGGKRRKGRDRDAARGGALAQLHITRSRSSRHSSRG